jgi:general secretion pathway protein D
VSSYTYKNVGINVIVTPRVTFDGDVVLELSVENSGRTGRKHCRPELPVVRVAQGRDEDSASATRVHAARRPVARGLPPQYKGFPGLIHLPSSSHLHVERSLLGQTDIVMLLTPRIVRGHELTQQDVDPVYIGRSRTWG